MYSVYVAVIICWCYQKGVMGDTVITVIAPEKAIHNTEDLVRHATTAAAAAHASPSVGSFLFDCLKTRRFQRDTFCTKNTEAVCVDCMRGPHDSDKEPTLTESLAVNAAWREECAILTRILIY